MDKRNSHQQKNIEDRRKYLDSIVSNTIDRPDTSSSNTSTAELERPKEKIKIGERPVTFRFKLKKWIHENLFNIVIVPVITVVISIISYFIVKYIDLNREVGIISTKIETIERNNSNMDDILKNFNMLKFQVEKLWQRIFESKETRK